MGKKNFNDLKKEVIDRDLCCYCGSCAGVCPTDNIRMDTPDGIGLPRDTGRCTDCGLCLEVCPGAGVDLLDMSRQEYNLDDYPRGLGPFRKIVLARMNDESLRKESTSGGAVTALLEAGIAGGLAGGALVVGRRAEDSWAVEGKVARSIEEVRQNIQSKYVVAANNRCIKDLKDDRDYIAVSLPCTTLGMAKMRRANVKNVSKVKYNVGLLCHSTMTTAATKKMLAGFGLKGGARKVFYRRGDFPGGFHAETADGEIIGTIPLNDLMPYFSRYRPHRCRVCVHHFNKYADISVADPFPFIDELPPDDKKWTVLAIRTQRGESLFDTAVERGLMDFREVEDENIAAWDRTLSIFERHAFLQVACDARLGRPVPSYGIEIEPASWRKTVVNAIKLLLFKDEYATLSISSILRRLTACITHRQKTKSDSSRM